MHNNLIYKQFEIAFIWEVFVFKYAFWFILTNTVAFKKMKALNTD